MPTTNCQGLKTSLGNMEHCTATELNTVTIKLAQATLHVYTSVHFKTLHCFATRNPAAASNVHCTALQDTMQCSTRCCHAPDSDSYFLQQLCCFCCYLNIFSNFPAAAAAAVLLLFKYFLQLLCFTIYQSCSFTTLQDIAYFL